MTAKRKHALTLYFDEHGTGLNLPLFAVGGFGVYGDNARAGAEDAFRQLTKDHSVLRKGSRKWGVGEFAILAEFVQKWDLFPFVGVVFISEELKRDLKRFAATRTFCDEIDPTKPKAIHALWFQVLGMMKAIVFPPAVFRWGTIAHLDLLVDRGVGTEAQHAAYRAVVERWTGEHCRDAVRERSAGESYDGLDAIHAARCQWGPPHFGKARGPLNRVADGVVGMVVRAHEGDEDVRNLMRNIHHTMEYRRGPGHHTLSARTSHRRSRIGSPKGCPNSSRPPVALAKGPLGQGVTHELVREHRARKLRNPAPRSRLRRHRVRLRSREGEPLLIEGAVQQADIVGYLAEREEEEIVVDPRHVNTVRSVDVAVV